MRFIKNRVVIAFVALNLFTGIHSSANTQDLAEIVANPSDNNDNTTSFVIEYADHEPSIYTGCGQCIGYHSPGHNTVSIVLYERGNRAYWVLTLRQAENGKLDVQFYFVDRNPAIPEKMRGTYYPVYDVTEYFDVRTLEFKPGGRVAGKLHPVKIKSLGRNQEAVFVGSFDIQLQ